MPLDGRRALVVEAESTLQRYLLSNLGERGRRTSLVPSLSDALGQLAHDDFCRTLVVDLDHEPAGARDFVTDLKLPSADPGAVIGLMRADPRLAPSVEGIDQAIGESALAELERTIRT